MILEQFYLGCLAQASYVIADEETRVAAVVDPRRDVDVYLDFAKEHGLEIAHVVLTHFHADFISGHLELRDGVGARIHLGRRGETEYDADRAADGDVIELGPGVRLRVLETPGHTPESISLVVEDLSGPSARPHAVLTGDCLFIGDVGRPDLMASIGVTADELANELYDSLHEKLLPLPDETLVYPAHGAGSLCGRALSNETVSTIGEQRATNYALQPMSREQFVALVTADQPEAPAYFSYDAAMNRKERVTLDESLAEGLEPLSLERVLALADGGAEILDVREPTEFAGAHLVGSINVGLVGKFATWAGSVVDRSKPVVLVADPGSEREAAMRLGRIGFDRVAGYLEGGMTALDGRDDLLRDMTRIDGPTLRRELASSEPPLVLDVRNPGERDAGLFEGSVNIPLARLPERLSELPTDRPIVVHCASGYRSSVAASLLQRSGREVMDLVGGWAAWAGGASCSA